MIIKSLLIMMLVASTITASAHSLPGQWTQVDPAERNWFKDQKSPRGVPCCEEADGTYAEEELRGGHYWTQFTWKRCSYDGMPVAPSYVSPSGKANDCEDVPSGWVQVPDDVVIHDSNRHGAPVVWWVKDFELRIRCYAPGAGL